VPRARYELFDAYYQTIYARETGKPGPLAAMLEERPRDIHAMHNWLGLVLQVNSERAGELDASVPRDDLRANAVGHLREQGYDPAEASQLADRIVQAVTTRLVLIVPKNDADVGFEVRSLQEFFAARAIASGSDTGILERLQATVEPAHWRNTWLLAAGKAFSDRDHLGRQIISILADVDNRDLLRGVVAPGADLALDMLADNLATASPALYRSLYRHALNLLDYPPDPDLRRRAPVLFTLAEHNQDLAFWLEHAVDQAARGTAAQLEAIRVVLELADRSVTPLALRLRPRLRELERLIEMREADAECADLRSLGDAVESVLAGAALSAADQRLAGDLAGRLAGVLAVQPADAPDGAEVAVPRDLIDTCLSREPVARLLAEATVLAMRLNPAAGSRLRGMMRVWIQRQALGQQVLELTYPSTAERMRG
jgi:hypothetical protein